jgi:hypothetical protein
MKKLTPATFLGLALLGLGSLHCGDSSSDTGDDGPIDAGKPQVTEWESVVKDLPFPLDGDGKINRITIGRKEYTNNFANRGNVEVLFDTENTISIEMQKYDFSDDKTANGDEATGLMGTFERMSLWAYNEGGGSPTKPTEADLMDAEKNCTIGTWKDACSVFIYYDGQSQPVRSGAHLRVHLPKGFKGELNVQTEDNENENSYPVRGNVTISGEGDAGWCGNGSVKMSAGVGKIKLCRNLSPAPACSADQIKGCEEFKDMMGNDAAWSPDCPCPAMSFGAIRIESLKPWAANITLDIPDGTWLNANVSNQSEAKPHDCKPVIENCSGNCQIKDDSEYTKAAEFNYPGEAAVSGAGFGLQVISAGCTDVKYIDKPEDWTADGEPNEELRGYLKLCTGCL